VDESVLNKERELFEGEAPLTVEVVVYTSSRETYTIPLGLADQEQVKGIHSLIRASFDTLAPTRGLTFVDQSGCTRHFNTNHVTCVEVRTR
jgi:hypothetical protein